MMNEMERTLTLPKALCGVYKRHEEGKWLRRAFVGTANGSAWRLAHISADPEKEGRPATGGD
jgi:hypothetical protein